ncbi:GNAT family N-acetyltransferase [Streptomyces sp. NPDC050164]|uniref:GNAT family N-acetyltransferase n=1 Tax=Streptomyces sp. NPDC050164 TaxID=3365605 RepID=UPI0037898FEB
MGDIEPGTLVVRRAEASDRTALTETDPIAAAGDRARRASIRRWCEQGRALPAEDARGPVGYDVLEYTFFEQGFLTLLTVAPAARRQRAGWQPAGLVHGLDDGDPELFYLCPPPNLSRSSTLRTFPETVMGKESRS